MSSVNMDKLLCNVCYDNFDEIDHRPLTLVPCGHTFCDFCVSNLTETYCPTCKTYFEQKVPNWTVLAILPKPTRDTIIKSVQRLVGEVKPILENLTKFNQEDYVKTKSNFALLYEDIRRRAQESCQRINNAQNVQIEQVKTLELSFQSGFETKHKKIEAEMSERLGKIQTELAEKDSKDDLNLCKLRSDLETFKGKLYVELKLLKDASLNKPIPDMPQHNFAYYFEPKKLNINDNSLGVLKRVKESEEIEYYDDEENDESVEDAEEENMDDPDYEENESIDSNHEHPQQH